MQTTVDYPSFPTCFVCGSQNPAGLHISFEPAPDGSARAEYTALPEHVGYPDMIHGGIMFTLMDEAVAWALCFVGLRGVTAKAESRFREPVRVGTRLLITGRITERERRIVRTRAELRFAENPSVIASEMDATMFLVPAASPNPVGPASVLP